MNTDQGLSPIRTNVRCLQVIDSLGTGGTEKMLLLLARKCIEHGVPFTAVSLSDDSESEIAREITALGGRVFCFPAKKLFDLKRIAAVRDLIRRENIDLVHGYLTYGNIVACLAGSLAGRPVIGSLRNLGDSPEYFNVFRTAIETLCLNLLSARVMCNGYAIAKVHSKRVRFTPIEVIPNAVDLPDLLPQDDRNLIRKELTGDIKCPIIISAGRLITVKGFSDLIEAVNLLGSKVSDVMLVIAGEGPERGRLEMKIADLGLQDRVRLLGYRKDAARLLQAADVYVNSSWAEGMSVAILEGMAAGLAVVATKVGDAARVVTDDTGLVVPPNDPERLAGALGSLLADLEKCRQMGQKSRERVGKDYSPEIWFRRMMGLYARVLNRKNSDGR